MDIKTTIERKNIDFDISRNLLIKEVEDKFRESSRFKTFAGLSKEEYDREYTSMLRVAKRDDYKLCDIDAQHLAEIFFLNNKKGYEKMLIDFCIENKNFIDTICDIKDIKKAKTKIRILTFNITGWLNNYLEERGKANRDLSRLK